MSRRTFAWSLAVPLMVAGTESGHWLAYRLVYPDPYAHAQALAASGHGYLSHAPTLFAVLGALGACSLLARSFGRARPAQVSLLPFLLLAPLAFTLQEFGELGFSGPALLTPTFLPGLLLQLPFALGAYLVARWLLRAADRLHSFLFDHPAPLVVPAPPRRLAFATVDLARLAPLATGYGERGPPSLRSI